MIVELQSPHDVESVPHHGTPDRQDATMPEPPSGTQAVDRAAAARLDRRARRRAARLRRDRGGLRAPQVDHLAAAGRARAHRLLERDADRRLRRRPAVLALRRPPRPLGRAGPPGPPDAGAARRGHRRDGQPRAWPAATASSTSPRSTRRYLLGTPRLDRDRRARRTAPRSARCSRLRRLPLPARPARAADTDAPSPTRARCAASSRTAARRGWAATVDELEVGLTGVAAPVRGRARRRGRRARRLRPDPASRRTGSTSSAGS